MTKPEAVVWGVVAAALAGVVALAALSRRAPATPPAEEPSVVPAESAGVAPEKTSELLPGPAGGLGDHPCVERSGRAMNTSELRGKFVVADFIFTNCGGPCPLMTSTMAKLQTALKGADDVRLVSFSVDPERDDVKALSEYADRYGADKDRWLFLRADMPQIREIAFDELHLVASREEPVVHSTKFALLDRDGRLRAYYWPSADAAWEKKLLADLETLRREPSK